MSDIIADCTENRQSTKARTQISCYRLLAQKHKSRVAKKPNPVGFIGFWSFIGFGVFWVKPEFCKKNPP